MLGSSYRLTTINQYGDILYTGQYKKNEYKNMGDYPESIIHSADKEYKENIINEVFKKLYILEEHIENLEESLDTTCKRMML